MKHLIIISTFLFLTKICFGQSIESFKIEQVALPEGHFLTYRFNRNKLTVSENGKKRKKIKLDQKDICLLDSVLNSIGLDTLSASYSRPIMDGIHHTFSINFGKIKKEIRLNNYYLESLDRFLLAINGTLKEKHQLISFGYAMLSRPDTLIYYLPDFYIDTFKIPKNYTSYRIMCFKKGYLVTEILDSIQLCDCRIYPTNKESEYKKRHYWRAFRLENELWKRKYFDNQNQIVKTEIVQDVKPYFIVKEKANIDIGAKPWVEIYRYYKTVIKNK